MEMAEEPLVNRNFFRNNDIRNMLQRTADGCAVAMRFPIDDGCRTIVRYYDVGLFPTHFFHCREEHRMAFYHTGKIPSI